ncbi:Hypothetical protein ETEE_2167 [Edwardsiella anguillarum ET080813]|uniref:Uncharacterized protein n=1 Tax=Edwardsiella anguillarum ET080813 TaxID=667120 RepID=A0A076LL55_9GAMM|nr:Hypothetical protein ETEE_2167 [Edwardsiella anguillarum ET080813]
MGGVQSRIARLIHWVAELEIGARFLNFSNLEFYNVSKR